jgi:hypothetical protein
VEKGISPDTNSILENSKQRGEKKLKFYSHLTILYCESILTDQGDKVLVARELMLVQGKRHL